jgi:GDP-L-fucose synthase
MNNDGKIYLAGHDGLVGSAIHNALKEKGYTNIIYRSFKELDLTNQAAVAGFFEAEKPDYVFIAAAKVGGIVANNTYRGQFIYENLMIQSNVIHQAYVHSVKKLLFLGSTCIYPRECPQPMKEEYLLTGTLEQTNEPYAIAKIAGLKMCESYNRQYGTTFMSVMPTNLYGPNDNFDLEKSHVLPALLRKIYLGKLLESGSWEEIRKDLNANPVEGIDGSAGEQEMLEKLSKYGVVRKDKDVAVEIWGTGTPMREFMYSTEMAAACVHLMESDQAAKVIQESPEYSWINIGTSQEIAIADLAGAIKDLVGFKGELFFDKNKPDGTPRKLTDTSRLKSLGFKSEITLEKGLKMMYQAYLARQ